jgi:hypothetical protein
MRVIVVIILAISLLFSYVTIASAEVLFGVSAETGRTDFSADYRSSLTDVSKSPNILILNGDVNLLLVHIYLEYGTADMEQRSFTTTGLKAGWEFGPSILKAKVFAGYQQYVFTDTIDNTYASLVGGLGIESKIDKLTFYGTTLIPVVTRFSNSSDTDNGASLNYLNLGVAYAPLPLIDLFVNYRTLKANSDFLNISANGYTMGAKFSF